MFRTISIFALLFSATGLSAADSDKYLPADTELVVRLNVRDMLDAPAVKKDNESLERAKKMLQQLVADYEGALKLLDAAGIDLYRDITTLTAALPGDADPAKMFVILDGKFDAARIKAVAGTPAKKADGGLKILQIAGQEIFELKLPALPQPVFAGLVDATTLIASGNKDQMAAAIAKAKEKADPAMKVQAVLGRLDSKQHLSFSGTRSAAAKMLGMLQLPYADALPAILEDADAIYGGLTINKEVDCTLRFATRDEKTARQFFQQMTLVLAVARGAIAKEAKNDKRLEPLVDLTKTLHTGVEGTEVVWRSQLTLDAAGKLLENLAK